MRMLLVIKPGGKVETIYHDALLDMGLGKIQTSRASVVTFNTKLQRWEAKDAKGKLLAHNRVRVECLRLEHEAVTRVLAKKHGYRLTPARNRF